MIGSALFFSCVWEYIEICTQYFNVVSWKNVCTLFMFDLRVEFLQAWILFHISLTLVSFEDILEYSFMNGEDYFQNLLWVYVSLSH